MNRNSTAAGAGDPVSGGSTKADARTYFDAGSGCNDIRWLLVCKSATGLTALLVANCMTRAGSHGSIGTLSLASGRI
ncbi:hypothetical protein [Paeniglutamicibacter cryotolerans]|uniref:Uncharacterized protein n=1 Tax=Paeniglutamicibacter cryotolerans TaxID=670079 RepID=A0A839QR49_9MICC|nr:hypothetical protein [Paeniglutamicibacter cryotolerans]MBB2996466.1 hypothetical protein [Paeniglutamicibacter cryotolerans]